MSVPAPAAAVPEHLHADGVSAFQAGDLATATDLLTRAFRASPDPAVLNDLAVVCATAGNRDQARALLLTCLTFDEGNADALANLSELDTASWRDSKTLGGTDQAVPERAYPGMAFASTMSEHAMRYSMALGLLPGMDVLDVGCGTGYGSEMLTWTAKSVRGFDLWQPAAHETPQWSGGAELNYGFDVCSDRLPAADAAVMFEITEHLHDAPAALRNVFRAVDTLIVSFPNPRFHGSHVNPHHVNDWTLEQFEAELERAALTRYGQLKVGYMYQPYGKPTIAYGRDPEAPFWIVVCRGEGKPARPGNGLDKARRLNLPR